MQEEGGQIRAWEFTPAWLWRCFRLRFFRASASSTNTTRSNTQMSKTTQNLGRKLRFAIPSILVAWRHTSKIVTNLVKLISHLTVPTKASLRL